MEAFLPLTRPFLPPLAHYEAELGGLWESRMLSNFGAQAERLERRAGSYFGRSGVLCVSSGDVGLTLAIAALGIEAGAEAIVPSFTHCSSLNALLWNGLRPRFCDVDPDGWCLDPDAVEAALTPQTRLIVATHTFGLAAPAAELEEVAAQAGARLLFDGAAAIATRVNGSHVSSHGHASVFSLGATKLVGCAEGGLASFADADAAERFRLLRQHGYGSDYESIGVGLNGKLSELHAALGVLAIEHLDAEVARREALSERYRARLGNRVGFAPAANGTRPSPTYMAIAAGELRDRLVRHLSRSGIETKSYYRPLHRMDPFVSLPRAELAATERLADSVICLPLFGAMADHDVDRVCDQVEAVLDGHG